MNGRVGVLGLGTMGGRAAEALVGAGADVVGFDPTEAARERAAAAGVEVVDDGGAVAAASDLVLLSVPRPEHVRSLADGPLAAARPGTLVVDLSTIDPGTAQDVARTLAERDVTYLDCPVLGRPAGCGSWTLVAGGDEAAVAAVTPRLEGVIAKRVVRVGDVGAGSTVKILNNLMFGAINAVTAEALHLCRQSGIDMDVFVDAVVDSGAATVSNLFRDLAPRIAAGDDEPVFALELLAKDNLLAQALASQVGSSAPITDAVVRVNARAVDLGRGARDSAAVIAAYENGTG